MNLGQVYTQRHVADFMAGLFDLPDGSRVLDPCFGRGVFVDALLARTGNLKVDAVEIDPDSFNSYIYSSHANSHSDAKLKSTRCYLRNFFAHHCGGYDGIIMNPPYVRQEEIDAMAPIGVTKKLLKKVCNEVEIPSKANLYVYFILHAVDLLKNGGQLVVIFPNAWFNTATGKFLADFFATRGHISRLIAVEGNPFEGNPIVDVCIMKFIKGRRGGCRTSTADVTTIPVSEAETTDRHTLTDAPELTLLESIANVRRGLTTLCNRIFINPPLTGGTHLHNIISSPKNLNGLHTHNAAIDRVLIIPKGETPDAEETAYLNACREHILTDRNPKTLLGRIQAGSDWFVNTPQVPADIIFPYIVRYTPVFVLNDAAIMARDNFYTITSDIAPLLLVALLNNHHIYLQLELCGKTYGNHVLKLQKYDIDALRVVNPAIIPTGTTDTLMQLAASFLDSPSDDNIARITDTLAPFYGHNSARNAYLNAKTKRLGNEGKKN